MAGHDTYLTLRTETDGSVLGMAQCDSCGPISRQMLLLKHEGELRQIAADHWASAPVLAHELVIPAVGSQIDAE